MDVASASCHVGWCLNMYNLCHAICSLLAPIRQNDFFSSNQVFAGTRFRREQKIKMIWVSFSTALFLVSLSPEHGKWIWIASEQGVLIFMCFYTHCPNKNSSESNKPLKDQSCVDPPALTDYSQITITNH